VLYGDKPHCLASLQSQRPSQACSSPNGNEKACFLLNPYLAYFWTLKIEAVHTSETLENFHLTTQRHISEGETFHDETELQIGLWKIRTLGR
jgi:hypothetical protein